MVLAKLAAGVSTLKSFPWLFHRSQRNMEQTANVVSTQQRGTFETSELDFSRSSDIIAQTIYQEFHSDARSGIAQWKQLEAHMNVITEKGYKLLFVGRLKHSFNETFNMPNPPSYLVFRKNNDFQIIRLRPPRVASTETIKLIEPKLIVKDINDTLYLKFFDFDNVCLMRLFSHSHNLPSLQLGDPASSSRNVEFSKFALK